MSDSKTIRWTINILIVLIAIITINYSTGNHSNGGCDGGLCVLMYIVHTLPMLIVWITQIIAFNLAFKKKVTSLIILAIGLSINTLIYLHGFDYSYEELYLESEILFAISTFCVLTYYINKYKNPITDTKQFKAFLKPTKHTLSKQVLTSSVIIYFANAIYNMLYFIRIIPILTDPSSIPSEIIETLTFYFVIVVALYFVYKQKTIAFYVTALILMHQLYFLLYFVITYEISIKISISIATCFFMIIGLTLEYLEVRKQKMETLD